MRLLRTSLDKLHPLFKKGARWELFYPIYEMIDTFLYTIPHTTKGRVHIRDGIDTKRVMASVSMALVPCIIMACLNTGYQANLALEAQEISTIPGWRGMLLSSMGISAVSSNMIFNFFHGLLYFLPVFIVTQVAGGICEVVFAIVRKHEINEGFLVTGMLYPLTLPPTIPLWQVALGIIFGVVIGKEIFGGTGRNFLNPALTARAFLYFAYPADISGEAVWVALDGYTQATPLGIGAVSGLHQIMETTTWWNAFIGFIPGSFGETSTLACLLGAIFLIAMKIGSWRIMLSVLAGMVSFSLLLNIIGSETNPMFSLTPHWHFVLGGFAFGMVFMATDPVSGAMTFKGQFFYGFLIGMMSVLIRAINPAFPEGNYAGHPVCQLFCPPY